MTFTYTCLAFCFVCSTLFCTWIETFYGPLEIQEPVLIELIESPAFQRLKSIHQYGVSYYTTHREEYTRYLHSLGVFAILHLHHVSLEEQIAGLLHDVSHTVFSHAGDWIYGKLGTEKDYQNSIHATFIVESGLEKILQKYGYTAEEILPLEELFPALEQNLPDLCADRIDYNIQGAYFRGCISYEEAQEAFKSLSFVEGKWVSNNANAMRKIAQFSLMMTQECWGGAVNYLSNRWLADAILRGVDIGLLNYEKIHFGTDQEVWNELLQSSDFFIQKRMEMIASFAEHYHLIDSQEADFVIKSKFRGIDPLIISNEGIFRLSEIDPLFCYEFTTTRDRVAKGWPIKLGKLAFQ